MSFTDPKRLLRQYEEGRITHHELLRRLIQAAARIPPSQIAAVLSLPELQELQKLSTNPPNSVEESPRSTCPGVSGDWELEIRQGQRLWHDGAWQWHRWFQGVST